MTTNLMLFTLLVERPTRYTELVVQHHAPMLSLNHDNEHDLNLEAAFSKTILLGAHPLFELRADPSSYTKRQQRSTLYVSCPLTGRL